jgi:hypothetical protein
MAFRKHGDRALIYISDSLKVRSVNSLLFTAEFLKDTGPSKEA